MRLTIFHPFSKDHKLTGLNIGLVVYKSNCWDEKWVIGLGLGFIMIKLTIGE